MESPDSPIDALDFSPDLSVPLEKRPDALRAAIGDLRRFRAGMLVVELEFSESAPPLQEAFTAVLLHRRGSL